MNKKRIWSTILACLLALCCLVEAMMIVALKGANKELDNKLNTIQESLAAQGSDLANLQSDMETKVDKVNVQISMPSDIYVTAGLTMEVYNNTIVHGVDLSAYDLFWSCAIGDCMNDKYHLLAKADMVGDYTLTLTIRDLDLTEVGSYETTLHVVPNALAADNVGQIDMVAIGDSMTDGTDWISYTSYLSGGKLFYQGLSGAEDGLHHEGIAGITAGEYYNGLLYGSSMPNHFTNPSTGVFDYSYYMAETGIDADVVSVFLGNNGLSDDPSANVDDIAAIVDNILATDAEVHILLVEPIHAGDQDAMARQQHIAGYEGFQGVWSYGRNQQIFALVDALRAKYADATRVTLVPASAMFDTENGFIKEEVSVSPHTAYTAYDSREGIHPSDAGYDQIGDCIYSTINYLLGTGAIQSE